MDIVPIKSVHVKRISCPNRIASFSRITTTRVRWLLFRNSTHRDQYCPSELARKIIARRKRFMFSFWLPSSGEHENGTPQLRPFRFVMFTSVTILSVKNGRVPEFCFSSCRAFNKIYPRSRTVCFCSGMCCVHRPAASVSFSAASHDPTTPGGSDLFL